MFKTNIKSFYCAIGFLVISFVIYADNNVEPNITEYVCPSGDKFACFGIEGAGSVYAGTTELIIKN